LIESEIQKASSRGENLEAFPLYKTREAEAKVIFSPRNISAVLYLRKAVAGALPLQMKTISEVIKNSGVHGFNAEKVKTDISDFMMGPQIELKDYVLVEGKDSTRGSDKEIVFLAEFFQDEKKQHCLQAIKNIPQWQNKLEADDAAIVAENKKVAELKASTYGEDGKDVFGNILPAQPGNDPELHLLRGLHQHGQDIIAEKSGLLLVKHEGNAVYMAVLDYRDSSVVIHVTDDKMEARIELLKEIGPGAPLKINTIAEKIAEAGIVRGIDNAAVKNAYQAAISKGQCPPLLIAKGEQAISGGGSLVTWFVPLKASHDNQLKTSPVQQGIVLAEVESLGEEGRSGFDVTGTELSPDQGISIKLEHNETVIEKPD
jgi:uncharacterized protein (DUF342 family)